ncbi:Surface antigen-like protein [Leptomonas seymouri]|uniref:Surface antigen-like protein n=1 Tax=Leptomonas seymouri TaxID=5684 RepID=A0A0N0P4M2_LEPSE|nr:Surface antigen-like protein [Leptomonas seymouri]|eukprot:KPI84987.1 Surface antigen-like protein [Leptomonas seymouri]
MVQGFRPTLLAVAVALVLSLFAHGAYADFTEASYVATHLFLSSFPRSFPSLQSTWRGPEFCSWPGIECDNASAATSVSVNLSGRNLRGSMPTILNEFTGHNIRVVSIDLSNNRGIIGAFIWDWAVLVHLAYLNLSSTSLTGAIPDSWNNMRSLVTLSISNTNACRGLPQWNITTLREVDISQNNLRGILASSWGSMTQLASVDIRGNRFCGCVPSTWNNSTVLMNAVEAVGGNLVAPSCQTSNRCTSFNYMCDGAAMTSVSAALVAGLLVQLLVVIAAV